MTFNPIENRDAWATIRGFVYQVQITLLHWLQLDDGQVLELEKGEDIDIVTQAINKQEIDRILGQSKYREKGVSLGQNEVIEILLNYFIHKKNNPKNRLKFLYISNSESVLEKPAIFLDGKKGIEVWTELRNSTISLTDPAFIKIKNHLISKVDLIIEELEGFKNSEQKLIEWKEFKDFIGEDNQLLNFIEGFEWSLGNGDPNQLKEKIDNLILTKTSVDPSQLYSRLFLHVFELLCEKGEKTLTKSQFIQLTNLPELTSNQSKWLGILEELLSSINNRIEGLEKHVRINSEKIGSILSNKTTEGTADLEFSYQLKALTINAPATVNNGSLREKKLGVLQEHLKIKAWVAIQGINGSGKTQLAALCSKKFNSSYWLDLRPFSQHHDKLHLILGTFLSNISGVDFVNDAEQWLKIVIDKLPAGSLLILNDVPANGKNDKFDELIILFTNMISSSNVRLLTTSNHSIAGTFSEKIDADNVIEYIDLEFDDDELKEYLTNSGAPDEVIKFSSLISAVTKNNPRLVSAVIQALKDISWGSNSTEVFDVLFEKKFGSKVFETVQSSIKELISDQESKELLYRLSLINWTLEINEIQVIAAVPEPIKYPNEKLSDLNNIWIQQIDGSKYQISPLIDQIGKQNLTDKVIKAVYVNVAKSLLKGKIDQIRASRIITLFISANEVNQAGIILVNFLQSAQSIQEAQIVDEWGYLHYWTSTSFPMAMDFFLRAHIIFEQIRLKSLLGKDTSRSFSNMESILAEKEITKEVEFVVRIFCLTGFHNQIQPSFSGHLEKLLNEIDEVDETFKELLTAETVGGLLWILMQQITSYDELIIWLNLIDTAENKLELDFFSNEIAPTAIAVLSSRVVNLSEFKKPENLSVTQILSRFQKFFQDKNNEVLESTVLKEIVALTFHEGEDKRIEAKKITENAAQRFNSGNAKYLMYENYGKLLKNIDDSDSEVYLEKALSFEYTNHSTYIDTLIHYASIISPKNSEKAIECCFQAVQLAKQRENFEELYYIQVNAELGLAYWLDGRSSKSYEVFDLVVSYLFDLRDKSDIDEERWVRLFKRTGHALGYISADTREVDLPQKTRDDGEYIKPYQGFFSFNTNSLMHLYNKIEDPFLFVHMAFFAEGVDRLEEAYEWSQKAFDLSQRNQDSKVFFMVSSISSQYPLLNFKVSETIESVLFFSAITSHLQGSTAEEKNKELEGINISEVLGEKPSENWNVAEQNTITFALTPLFVMVLTSELEEDGLFELKQKSFIDAIRNYIPKASSTLDWEIILEISAKIFKKEIRIKELVDRSNTFNKQGRQSLQLMCILGIIHLSKNGEEIAQQLINITPYLLKTQSIRESSIRYILYPFIKETVKKSLKNSFVGEKAELEQKIQIIEDIKRRDENCIQLMLQPLIEELQIQIPPDRKRWLYDFEEI